MSNSKFKISKKSEEVAIKVENVSKTFKIPHEKHSSLKSAALNVFKNKTYTEFQAAKDISFEVKKGEFFGIIGRNGSGKSTLLKMLAGIYTPDSGKITINGKLSPFLELGVGFNPELTARENVYLGGSILGLSRKEIDSKFDEIIKFAELEEFIDMKFKNFSSGMQVRLAFALSINAHAEILLMDEVLAVGDNNFQTKCLKEFGKYRDMGKTVVLVSHDTATIQRYCDQVILLRNGFIEMIGSGDAVVDQYIRQNMDDEKILKKVNSKKDSGENNNDRTISIEGVYILDGKGVKRSSLETGKPATICIKIKRKKEVKNVNVGVGLYSSDGSYIFGYNTQMEEYSVSKVTTEINLFFKELPILQGSYYINVVCFGKEETSFYDYKPKVKKIEMYSLNIDRNYRGVLSIDHEWSQNGN